MQQFDFLHLNEKENIIGYFGLETNYLKQFFREWSSKQVMSDTRYPLHLRARKVVIITHTI